MGAGRVIFIVCVVVFTVVAAVCDWRTKRLPNVLTVTSLAGALLFHAVSGAVSGGFGGAFQQLGFSLAGFATGFGILLIMWLMGSGGGGDVKYMGALGAWLGAMGTLKVFLVSAVLILICSVAVLAWEFCRRGFRRTQERYVDRAGKGAGGGAEAELRRKQRRRLMPFGVPAAIATWLVLAASQRLLVG